MCYVTSDYKARKLYAIEQEKRSLKARLKELEALEGKYLDEIKENCNPEKGNPVKDSYRDMTITVSAVTGSRRCNYTKLKKLSIEIYNEVVTQGNPTKSIKFGFTTK